MTKDVQKSSSGFYQRAIEKVGVRNILIPLMLEQRDSTEGFKATARVSSYCDLVEDVKGIHMSRIGRTINEVLGENLSFNGLLKFVHKLKEAHGARDIYIKAVFDYLIDSTSPVTNLISREPATVTMETKLQNGKIRSYISVKVTEMSLCPCSKEMSMLVNNLTTDEARALENSNLPPTLLDKITKAGFGAHNQKSYIEVSVEIKDDHNQRVWIEDLVEIAKKASSAQTFATLKRPDEKYVTEVSYMGGYFNEDKCFVEVGGGAKFVEDIARDAAKELDKILDKTINDYVVVVTNEESIHSGDIEAVAVLSAGRNLQ